MNLRELTQEQKEIQALIENGDFTAEQVADHMQMLEGDIKQKIEDTLYVLANKQSRETALTSEIERLTEIKNRESKEIERIKEWLLFNLDDGQKFEFDLFTVSRVKGREVLGEFEQSKLPARYIKTKETVSVDRVQLLKDVKAGIAVEGVSIAIGEPSLRIK